MRTGKYVVIDGMDGSGKGTQMKFLLNRFPNSVVWTREPGGTVLAEELRKMILGNPEVAKSTPLNHLLLFFAAREDHLYQLVNPMLQKGKNVLSDRGDSSTFAFQICGEKNKALNNLFLTLREHVFPGSGRRYPDIYVILDLPAETARKRVMKDLAREVTHFDIRSLAYYKRVRRGFQEFASLVSSPVVFIDASLPPHKVHELVIEALAKEDIHMK